MRHEKRLIVSLALGLSLAFFASSASAQGLGDRYSVLGGRPLRSGQSAFAGGIGYPSLWGQYELSAGESFGVGFRGDLFYGSWYGFGSYGLGFSVPMRIGLSTTPQLDVALTLTPGLTYLSVPLGVCTSATGIPYYCNLGLFGVSFEPGVMFGINLGRTKPITILAGGGVPINIYFAGGYYNSTIVTFGISLRGGVEFQVSRRLNIGGLVGFGPVFNGGPYALFGVVFNFIIEYLL